MMGRELDDLDDEIREHLERETQNNIDRGMAPAAARLAARRTFGSIALAKEDARAVWVPVWVDHLVQDLHYALRILRRNPGFGAAVILTLALGIGLNTAVFSVVNAVLLRPLSFPHPERVVWLATVSKTGEEFVPSADALAWRDANSLDLQVAYDEFDGRITANGVRMPARIATVSSDFWELSGAVPAIGRLPARGESEAVLSHGFFERSFGGSRDAIGRSVVIGGRPATIVGVLAAGFRTHLATPRTLAGLPPRDIEVYHEIVVRPPQNGRMQLFRVVGRLKPGVSIETARAELETIHARVVESVGAAMAPPALRVVPLTEKLVGSARPSLIILFAAVAWVLLVGCANIASLLLARASTRHREIAIRTAIGAGAGRLFRQFLVENLLLAIAGGCAGLLIARGCLEVMLRLIPQAMPRLTEATLDLHVLGFAIVISALTALLFGVGPASALRKANAYDALKDGARPVSANAAGARARSWLVAAEVALTLTLLCGAGLLVKSLWKLTATPPGFAPDQTVTMTVQYDTGGSANSEVRRREFVRAALERIGSIPAVQAAGMTTNAAGRTRMFIEGVPPTVPFDDRPLALQSSVSAGYAPAIGMRVIAGRWVTDDEPAAVFVVNESLARHVFPGGDPIGHRLQVDGPPGATEAQGATFGTIVGVVADLKYNKLESPAEPELFADFRHASPYTIAFVARVSGEPRAVGQAMRSIVIDIDRTQPISSPETIEDVLIGSIAPRRFTVFLLAVFAGSALVLALIGLYGVIAYSVAVRTREIGVRMALGADRYAVVLMVVRQGMTITIAGLAVGVVAGLALTRVMAGLLYDVAPNDPAIFAVAAGIVGATALAACCVPAFQAARVDPLVALRSN
ncbi:MAG: ABC transporter permease [Vicinamibacterales bacterium]